MKKTLFGVSILLLLIVLCSIACADDAIVSIAEGTSFNQAPSVYPATIYQSTGINGDHNTKSGYFCISPSESDLYKIVLNSPNATRSLELYIYDVSGKTLAENCKANAVSIDINLEAGKTYYMHIRQRGLNGWSYPLEAVYYFSICNRQLHTDMGNWQVQKAANCVEAGSQIAHCSRCGDVAQTQVLPALGHTPGDWQVEEQPTCAEPGWNVKRCTTCKMVCEREEITKKAHTEGPMTLVMPAGCAVTGYSISYCSVCGVEMNRATENPKGHTLGTFVEVKAATCTAEGTLAQHCTSCMKVLSTQIIPTFGHSPAEWAVTREAACQQSGLKEKKCSTCGATLESEQLNALGHSYTEWEILTEATKEVEGEQRRHCINCGDTQFEKIPKVEKLFGIF